MRFCWPRRNKALLFRNRFEPGSPRFIQGVKQALSQVPRAIKKPQENKFETRILGEPILSRAEWRGRFVDISAF